MYTALKYCNFGGKTFRIGEAIPDDLINPMAIPRLKKMGVIAEHGGGLLLSAAGSIDDTAAMFSIPIFKDDQMLMITLTEEDVKTWSTVLQKTAAEAAEIIETIDNDNLLLVIHATDGRKSVKTAAETRAAAIIPAEEEEEETPEVPEEETPAEEAPEAVMAE